MPNTQPPTSDYAAARDKVILDAVHKGTLLPRGETINADMFPVFQKAVDNLTHQEVQKAEDNTIATVLGYKSDVIMRDFRDVEEPLLQLVTTKSIVEYWMHLKNNRNRVQLKNKDGATNG